MHVELSDVWRSWAWVALGVEAKTIICLHNDWFMCCVQGIVNFGLNQALINAQNAHSISSTLDINIKSGDLQKRVVSTQELGPPDV